MSEPKRVFLVTVGIGGALSRPIEADTEDEAIDKFWQDWESRSGLLSDPGFELDWDFDIESIEAEDDTPDRP